MKNALLRLVPTALLLAALGGLASCALPTDATAGPASVTLSASTVAARSTILPRIEAPASYRYVVTGGPTALEPIESAATSVTVQLDYGTYDVLVEGFDSGGVMTCSGSVPGFVVSAGGLSQVVTLSALTGSGDGTVDLTIRWPGVVAVEAVEASLVPVDAVEAWSTLVVDGMGARLTATKPAGSYQLSLRYAVGGVTRNFAPRVVQVAQALASAATLVMGPGDFPLEVLDVSGVACGDDFTLLLKADGTIWSWGANGKGQLGDGTLVDRPTPGRVGNDSDWIAVEAYATTAYALKADGSLWRWGGTGALTQPTLLGADSDWKRIFAGYNLLAIKTDGSLWKYTWEFTRVGVDSDWVEAASGYDHWLAVKGDGTLWAWGDNYYGELGDGTFTDQPSPIRVGTDADWARVAAGTRHTIAVKTDGTLWTWGDNTYDQLGDDTIGDRGTPARIGGDTDWTVPAAGYYHSFALKASGALWGWGYNRYGMVGDGSSTDRVFPTPIAPGRSWKLVDAYDSHSVGIDSSGAVFSWGNNDRGQLGDGEVFAMLDDMPPTRIGLDTDWTAVEGGLDFLTAMKSDGSLWASGAGDVGQLGDGSASDRSMWVEVGSFVNWAAGDEHVLALKDDGTLWVWGEGTIGRFGTDLFESASSPRQSGIENDWESLAANNLCSYAIKNDGSLWGWGSIAYGALGRGDGIYLGGYEDAPLRIGRRMGDPLVYAYENDWAAVKAGQQFAAALKDDGTLWAWGENAFGQVGDGTTTVVDAPIRVGTDSDWAHVFAGKASTFAIKTDGSLWAWGANGSGRLGIGSAVDALVPTRVGTATDWAWVSNDGSHTVALKTNGELWAWGNNSSCQLGDGTTTATNAPYRIGDEYWLAVAAREGATIAIKSDGSLWAWGDNYEGRLGVGTSVPTGIGLSAY